MDTGKSLREPHSSPPDIWVLPKGISEQRAKAHSNNGFKKEGQYFEMTQQNH